MNKAQREATRSTGAALSGLLDLIGKASASLLVSEIIRARAYLGAATSDAEREQLLAAPVSRLTQEAQTLREAVALRSQTEIAEHTRNLIAADKATKSPGRGPLTS